MSQIFSKYGQGKHAMPDTPPQAWPPGLLFRRWEGSKALPSGSLRGAMARPPERTDLRMMAPRESTKASKNFANRSLAQMDSLQTAIALHEETEMSIEGLYIKTIGNEVNSSKSKATLAILARHFRLQRLNDVLIDIVEMECELERWHKNVKELLPDNFETCIQGSTKKLEEVSKVLHNKWVSAKAKGLLDAQYCLKQGKYLESKIAQLHDLIEETLRILFDLVGKMYDGSGLYDSLNLPEMPFSKLTVHKKIVGLPGKYVVVQC